MPENTRYGAALKDCDKPQYGFLARCLQLPPFAKRTAGIVAMPANISDGVQRFMMARRQHQTGAEPGQLRCQCGADTR